MFKYIFLLVNSIAVLVYNLLFGDGVSITPKFPDKASSNSEFVAEVIVNKSNVSGFAKLQIELPPGLTAKEIENKGSTFSCTNGIVKFIWTALPQEESFVLKFNVIADGSCSGTKDIKGKFSYLLNNEKKQHEFGPVQVAFSENVAQSTSNSTNQSSSNTSTSANSNSTATNSNSAGDFNPTKKENEPLSIHRRITKIAENTYKVEVVFFKDNILGFAKHTEKIPEGFKAKEEKSSGASFNTNQTFVKYLWASLPDKEEVRISYIIEQVATPPANGVIKGEFIYLDQEETKKVYSDEDAVPLSSPIAAASATQTGSSQTSTTSSAAGQNNAANVANQSTKNAANDPAIANSTVKSDKTSTGSQQASAENTPKTTNQTATANSTSTAAAGKQNSASMPETKNNNASGGKSASNSMNASGAKTGTINYHVQVGAYKNNVTAEKVSSELGLSENLNSDMHEGLTKFLVGNYSEYKEARNKREALRSGNVKDAFVSAYNGPKRVTVQEALMITSQKWAP